MELDWSAQSPHIRSLFHPWQPGDGYDEATIQAAEARLGVRLPATLRNFYLAWGRRRDMTKAHNPLLNPDGLVVCANTLIFCAENQAILYWGVPCEALEEDDPPVMVTWSGESGWDVESELDWTPSHAHLSSFLDDFTYDHAFAGGSIHGCGTGFGVLLLSDHHIAWLEEKWSRATVGPLFYGVIASDSDIDSTWSALYVREGQAFCQFSHFSGLGPTCWLAAREAEALDEISQRFQITWKHQWRTGTVNNLMENEFPEHIEVHQSDPPYTYRSRL